eukprot:gene3287-2269_t
MAHMHNTLHMKQTKSHSSSPCTTQSPKRPQLNIYHGQHTRIRLFESCVQQNKSPHVTHNLTQEESIYKSVYSNKHTHSITPKFNSFRKTIEIYYTELSIKPYHQTSFKAALTMNQTANISMLTQIKFNLKQHQ